MAARSIARNLTIREGRLHNNKRLDNKRRLDNNNNNRRLDCRE